MFPSGGVFLIGDWLMLTLMTVVYFLLPSRFLPHKYEYVKFFLVFLSAFFLLLFIIGLITSNREGVHMIFKFFGLPTLFVSHWLYKFKTVNKNKTLSFFLFFATLFLFVGVLAMGLLFAWSGGHH